MTRERSDAERALSRLFKENKSKLDLVATPKAVSGFGLAVARLFGDNPVKGKVVKIASSNFAYFGWVKGSLAFLPAKWRDCFDKTPSYWNGCANWWAGYPLIAWIEMRPGDELSAAYLKLNAEVGPIADHLARRNLIREITASAAAANLDRIRFENGASDKGRLYSRFLNGNALGINDPTNTDEIEAKILRLLGDFELEFAAVGNALR